MKLDTMTTGEKLTVGGSVLAAIGTFLPWFTASIFGSTITVRGIDGDGKFILVLAAIAGGIVFFRSWERYDHIAVLVSGLLMVLISGMYVIEPTSGVSGSGEGAEIARQVINPAMGLYLSALGSLGALIGGWIGFSSEKDTRSQPTPIDQ